MIYSTVKLIKTFYPFIKMIEYLYRIVTNANTLYFCLDTR